MSRKTALFIVLFLLLSLSACVDNPGKTYGDMDYIYPGQGDIDSDSDGDADKDKEHIYIPPEDGDQESDDGIVVDGGWQSCPLYSDGTGPTVECSKTSMPLNYAEPEGRKIPFFVMRYKAAGESRGQLWLLQGGPGGPGSDFAGFMESMHLLYPTLDLYAPDHRGTGYSARLGCSEQEADYSPSGFGISSKEWPNCIESIIEEWGEDGLAQFTASNAARDLGEALALFEEPGKEVFVYGASYGTYWALRYMQLYPNQGTKIILDSLCPSGHCKLVDYDANFNMVGRQFMEHCASDDFCKSKLGDDAWAFLGDLYEKIDNGHCSALARLGVDRPTLRRVFGSLIMSWWLRPYIAMTAYRMNRCSDDDVSFLIQFFTMLFSPDEPSVQDKLFSSALNSNVTFSEIWGDGEITTADLENVINNAYVSPDAAWSMSFRYDIWPKYPKDEYYAGFGNFDGPILMLNGTLDPQTPLEIALPVKDAYTAENQYFIEFPRLPHGVIFQFPDPDSTDLPCGLNVFLQYLDNPNIEPDSSCTESIPSIDWHGNSDINTIVFGTDDVYEGSVGGTSKSALPRSIAAELEKVKRMLREQSVVRRIF